MCAQACSHPQGRAVPARFPDVAGVLMHPFPSPPPLPTPGPTPYHFLVEFTSSLYISQTLLVSPDEISEVQVPSRLEKHPLQNS